MGLCLWLRYEWDFKHYVYEMEAQKVLWTGPYILMASSALAMATVVIGIRATIVEHSQLLLLVSFSFFLPFKSVDFLESFHLILIQSNIVQFVDNDIITRS